MTAVRLSRQLRLGTKREKHSAGLRAALRYDTLKAALGGAAF